MLCHCIALHSQNQKRVQSLDISISKFPARSVEFGHALIMRNLAHEWHSADDLYI